MSSSDTDQRIKDILTDLFSLEINTIVKCEIMATKMPNTAHALIDIAIDYRIALKRESSSQPLPERVASWQEFDEIREAASTLGRAIEGRPSRETNEDSIPNRQLTDDESARLLMLCRIRDMSDQLKTLFNDGGEPDKETLFFRGARDASKTSKGIDANVFDEDMFSLKDSQRLILRKAWEVGTESVAAQTVIYLDGDIVTRVRPDHFRKDAPALSVHQRGVETSVSFWNGLIEIAKGIVGTLAGLGGAR